MRWDPLLAAFGDELEKIGEFNLSGLSPETVASQKAPAAFSTPGLSRALEILERSYATKTAKERKVPEFYDSKDVNDARRAGGAALGGAGIGTLLSGLTLRGDAHISPRRKSVGALIGATAGLTDHLLERRYQRRKKEQRKGMSKKAEAALPPELLELEMDRKIEGLVRKDPSLDAEKLKSKAKAMRRGAAIGAAAVPLGVAASMLHRAPREYLKNKWKASPIETAVTWTPAIAGFSTLGSKAGSSIGGKLHDLRHGKAVEKTSAMAFPAQQLAKGQKAFRFSTQSTFRPPAV